ncbi:MAG: SpoIID/LytB domain-containing protein [Chloroflexi bacterium]|nr:SpoIID/LytB domain-containing protein [Chloroflexota bacterium]
MADSEIELALTPPASIRVLMPGGHVEEMKLETYLAGAIAAEIGEKVPLEALKAQAVASRTYVVAAERHREQNAHVCTTAHCQKWKRVDPVSCPEVFRALSETWGMVAVYNGNLIQTFFFEHCDGHTRNAEELLMPSADYLRGVDCSCGHLTLKGHGVGMCKRGTIVMARRGATFVQILRHYYRGIAIGRMQAESPVARTLEEVAPPRAPEAKKIRVRRMVQEGADELVKPTRLRRPPIKVPPEPILQPKLVTPKRPVLKRIVLSKPVPSEKPEPTKPLPTLIDASRAVSVDSKPTIEKSGRENFVVVPRAVAPMKPKSVEPAPLEKQNGNGSADSEPIIIHVPKKKPESIKPTEQIQESIVTASEPVEPAPTTFSKALIQVEPVEHKEEIVVESAQVTPLPAVEPVTYEEETRVESVQAAPLQTVQPIKHEEVAHDESVQVTPPQTAMPVAAPSPAPSPHVPETALPPLEGVTIKPMRRLHVDHLPGTRMIAGNLPRSGIVVVIEAGDGKQTLVFSGTAPHYGEGGFETIIDEDGVYHVLIEGQTIEVKVQGETAFIHAG